MTCRLTAGCSTAELPRNEEVDGRTCSHIISLNERGKLLLTADRWKYELIQNESSLLYTHLHFFQSVVSGYMTDYIIGTQPDHGRAAYF